jgi:sugar phosphate isomerase/epimerase
MTLLNRRAFLNLAVAAPVWAARGLWKGKAALGANTTMRGIGFSQAVALLRELQFPVIEIQGAGVFPALSGRFAEFDFTRLTADEKNFILGTLRGVPHVTMHLPYHGHTVFSADPEKSAASLEGMKRALEAAAFLGCEVAVIHTTDPEGMTIQQAWPLMVRRFREWGDVAAAGKFRLAIETGTGGIDSAREFIRFIREIDHPQVGCTLDVGHEVRYREFQTRVPDPERSTPAGVRAYNDVILQLVDALGPKLFHFHVHDIDPAAWKEHVPVGTAVIDYTRLMTELRRMNYAGYFIIEIAAPDMRASLADTKRRMEAFLEA